MNLISFFTPLSQSSHVMKFDNVLPVCANFKVEGKQLIIDVGTKKIFLDEVQLKSSAST